MKRPDGTLTVTVDPAAIPMAAAVRAAAAAGPLLVITARALGDLAAELGSIFLPPRGWTRERLAGWAAGQGEHLEREFGEVADVHAEPAGRGAIERGRCAGLDLG